MYHLFHGYQDTRMNMFMPNLIVVLSRIIHYMTVHRVVSLSHKLETHLEHLQKSLQNYGFTGCPVTQWQAGTEGESRSVTF